MRPIYLHTDKSAYLAAETNCEGVLIWTRDSAFPDLHGTQILRLNPQSLDLDPVSTTD
jgi:hypothetical protein